ncbi:MAG: HAMP domain-containing histidine kinase [Oscillospiraceae bacterium]|nr:HAMP domain-containing histidine kinase [Oscillospiraceae bacterium]
MNRISVKLRITLWLTALMLILALLLMGFMLFISSTVATQTAMRELSQTVQNNLQLVSYEDGTLSVDGDFSYYHSGVTTLIYSRSETLLAGQVPVAFTGASESFQNGVTRTVSVGEQDYLVMDLWLASGWEDGVWIRGVMAAPDTEQTAKNLITVALIALPAFLVLVAAGSYVIVRKSFKPLDSISATAAAISEASDLSQRIALPPGRDEFTRLADTFNQLFQRLERSFEAEKQFTADASHELRTPVSIIKGACEYAEKYDETPEEREETITMIHRQAVRMSDLIAQLLSMTRLEQGTEIAKPEPVELGELARSVCQEQDYRQVEIDCPVPVTVPADPALMGRLIANLIDNGFKYGRPEGHVWVSVRRQSGETLLEVRDDGIGISTEEQEKVWQRFYQVDASRGDEGGAGLGLAMVRQIAQAHGGYMTLDSVPGVGSRFTLHLPE